MEGSLVCCSIHGVDYEMYSPVVLEVLMCELYSECVWFVEAITSFLFFFGSLEF